MLGEVLLELVDERLLVARELLPVVGREEDRVLVRDVDPRDRDGLAVVHLLRELARELDGLDVRAERTPEDALEERLDLVLDLAQHGSAGDIPRVSQCKSCPRWPCRPTGGSDGRQRGARPRRQRPTGRRRRARAEPRGRGLPRLRSRSGCPECPSPIGPARIRRDRRRQGHRGRRAESPADGRSRRHEHRRDEHGHERPEERGERREQPALGLAGEQREPGERERPRRRAPARARRSRAGRPAPRARRRGPSAARREPLPRRRTREQHRRVGRVERKERRGAAGEDAGGERRDEARFDLRGRGQRRADPLAARAPEQRRELRRRRPLRGIERERAVDRGAKRRGQVRALASASGGAPCAIALRGLGERRTPERVPAGERLVEQHADRPDVARRLRRLAVQALGRDVGERSGNVARRGERFASGSRASPKSSRRTEISSPSAASRTFAGFTSRWTMPCACACASASSTCAAASTATPSVTAPARSASRNVRPDTYS